ncbi:tyrosine-protein phosphatase [Qipengyuania spongiae]|uniref:Tyrosine-protein phosphatase n=1 Tax=Qipengyuania spongiae TaxID=2909673 RepID=A0ABY5SU88_9SPHN|nr:tyrosine-protein phosphatase [Qipengyuania spongiae]UVI38138.1 tyrosine-protein phosphatase [Qipengyuania spongiae]
MTNSERFLATEGIHNFRDFGGWPVAGGGRVKRGLLFRSGHHVQASDADLVAIAALDIRTVIDLRGSSERERNPCRRVDGFDGEVLFYDGETSSAPPHMHTDPSTVVPGQARQRMIGVYTRMVRNPAMQTMFARYLRVLAEREGASLVHCFAGKDRTGVAATLLLHILGVLREDQIAEFMRTNAAPTLAVLREQSVPILEERLGRKLEEVEIRARLEVDEDYLATFFYEVEKDYGSLDTYLAEAIGVDEPLKERLRARFVT